MFSRVLSLAVLCCLSAPCLAEVLVQDGDYYEQLKVVDGSLLMTGGEIGGLRFQGSNARIEGGQIGGMWVSGESLDISGGTINAMERNDDFFVRTDIRFHGYYFRVLDYGRSEANFYEIQGWLLDGSFINTTINNNTEALTRILPLSFIIEPSDGLPGDTNGDWQVDLVDLNSVRNNFGGSGDGDTNGDSLVDLTDLNNVRNHFGGGSFTLPPELAITSSTAVPEPSSFVMALAVFGLVGIALRCRSSRHLTCRSSRQCP